MTQAATDLTKFQWSPQPQAAALVQELLDEFLRRCPEAAKFAERLHRETGTRFIDWVRKIWLPCTAPEYGNWVGRLRSAGFEGDTFIGRWWSHPAGLFPWIVLGSPDEKTFVSIQVESLVDFLLANGLSADAGVSGEPLDTLRQADVFEGDGTQVIAEERHGLWWGPIPNDIPDGGGVLKVSEMFRLRRRDFQRPSEGFAETYNLIDRASREPGGASDGELGTDRAADLFFSAEREYWMSRNRAAQIQYARQQKLGLGWANHDHHTYRSSREHFKDLIAIFEKLGLVCRERFYAGREAGWGAQVMEQPNAGIVVFADVDLSPDEVTADFAHEPLPPRKELGTVGLWCALHGESFLEAGMHHLECQFDFDAAREQLMALGVNSMKPFTDFPYLKQCFTEGEMWHVEPKRIEALLAAGRITPEQAEKFRRQGAIGSHLEILERNDGYKGFNQTGISEIIRQTDPRNAGGARG